MHQIWQHLRRTYPVVLVLKNNRYIYINIQQDKYMQDVSTSQLLLLLVFVCPHLPAYSFHCESFCVFYIYFQVSSYVHYGYVYLSLVCWCLTFAKMVMCFVIGASHSLVNMSVAEKPNTNKCWQERIDLMHQKCFCWWTW